MKVDTLYIEKAKPAENKFEPGNIAKHKYTDLLVLISHGGNDSCFAGTVIGTAGEAMRLVGEHRTDWITDTFEVCQPGDQVQLTFTC